MKGIKTCYEICRVKDPKTGRFLPTPAEEKQELLEARKERRKAAAQNKKRTVLATQAKLPEKSAGRTPVAKKPVAKPSRVAPKPAAPVATSASDSFQAGAFKVAASDLDYQLAKRAHSGTSFDPEKRAKQAQSEYVNYMRATYQDLERLAITPEQKALLQTEMATFKEGWLKRQNAYLSSRSGIVSSMIAGPARFPKTRMEKRNATADKRLDELLEYQKNGVARIRRQLAPPERKVIQAGSSSEIEDLQAKLQAREKTQALMTEANKIVRSGKDVEARLQALGLTLKDAQKLLSPGRGERPGFQAYQLQNNNAEIRRLKQRLEEAQKRNALAKEAPEVEKTVNGLRIVEDREDNRIRLYFPGKPTDSTRSKLKSQGWRWSPTNGAWQKNISNQARYQAEEIAKGGL